MTIETCSNAVRSLGREARSPSLIQFYDSYGDNYSTERSGPLNTRENIQADILTVLQDVDLPTRDYLDRPYWLPKEQYSLVDVFGATIQFFDEYDGPLPVSVIPPEKDVADYICVTMRSRRKLVVSEQFRSLLKITKNPIGAANLGFIASRVMARGADTRAYPNIIVGPDQICEWNNHVAQFETADGEIFDGPGDTYYFWTHVFIAALTKYFPHGQSMLLEAASRFGTKAMTIARRYIAKSPTVSGHVGASTLGRETGILLGKYCKSVPLEKSRKVWQVGFPGKGQF
jgi:hypothetical protein